MNSIRDDIKQVIDNGIKRKQTQEDNQVIQPNIIRKQSVEAAEQYYVGGNSGGQMVYGEYEGNSNTKRRNKYLDEINKCFDEHKAKKMQYGEEIQFGFTPGGETPMGLTPFGETPGAPNDLLTLNSHRSRIPD